ncbi:MAG TPA: glutamate-1-semialdehyde 2,1-aminomutase [Longimicrobiales bacterium]|nr:glutamate-1-semialdehyde 2,1-aminomutase [Longimicrobiales bacterium]
MTGPLTEVSGAASARLFDQARRLMPGGVNSPVRAFGRVGGEPFFVDRADGACIYDVDGRSYIDLVMSWGALMLGHAHPSIRHALAEMAQRGTSYGAPAGAEVELAQLVVEIVPSVEMVRFVNSGTEATMSAVRLARAATGRDLILKFNGCYHGHGDSFLVQAGSGVATLGLPDSPGVPRALAELTLSVPYNDVGVVDAAFAQHGDRIACIIVEPIIGNSGFIHPRPGFLAALRTITTAHGALLIFDEVMTGFRVAFGGAQSRFGIMPDLTTLGKVIGGGLPVGAYGGRRDLMAMIAPSGPVYQAGTLSGNPLAMAAGIGQLLFLRETQPYDELEKRARRLIDAVGEQAARLGTPFCGDAAGAMFGWHFVDGPVHDFETASRVDGAFFGRFHRGCLERGVFLPASPYEAAFLSAAHTDDIIEQARDRICDALREAVA